MQILQLLNFSNLKGQPSRINPNTLVRDRFSSAEGRAYTDIDPINGGWIYYDGSHWRAKCQSSSQKIRKDSLVQIIGRRNTTLFIEETAI